MTIADEIESLVLSTAGLTETALAEILFGVGAYQQRVNSSCRRLIKEGRIERQGSGGQSDPFRYHSVDHAAALSVLAKVPDRPPLSGDELE